MRNFELLLVVIGLAWCVTATAGPNILPGDNLLRSDIQILADAGIISGPVTTWPLSWGPVYADLQRVESGEGVAPAVIQSLRRVRARADLEMRTSELTYAAHVNIAERPTRIRTFQNTPRETAQIGGKLGWTGDWLNVRLAGQFVDDPVDGEKYRADGSSIGFIVGNYSISANTLDRWWGPGWDSSLILSSNARSIPAISLERNFNTPFENKWLSWIGPWDVAIHYGQFESDREVPRARFFAARLNFKPIRSLEIGLFRSAQWCGRGRPCGFGTFADLLLGKDNRGEQGISLETEPGNQLAGVDFRWAHQFGEVPLAIYGQLMGEDEAGGFPSRYLGQFGVESTGVFRQSWSYRWFGEFAGTSCQFHESSAIPNCAYNHSIYRTGYRYRGRAVGHSVDNDARIISTGIVLASADEAQWQALFRFGELNRIGSEDLRNSLTSTPQDIASIDLTYSRKLGYGWIELGAGMERIDAAASGLTSNDGRGYLQWRSSY